MLLETAGFFYGTRGVSARGLDEAAGNEAFKLSCKGTRVSGGRAARGGGATTPTELRRHVFWGAWPKGAPEAVALRSSEGGWSLLESRDAFTSLGPRKNPKATWSTYGIGEAKIFQVRF